MSPAKCAALLVLGHSALAGLAALGLAMWWYATPDVTFGVACVLIPLCCGGIWLLWRNG